MITRTTKELTDLLRATATCTCRTYPAVHAVTLHDQHGQVADVDMTPSSAWDALHHATCQRCGWRSEQSWFREDFRKPSTQTNISRHRDRWTGECLPSPVLW